MVSHGQRDGHSSGTRVAARLVRPTRTAERECSCASRRCHPYSVLLPVGFTLPPPLPGARCALAAPFRPCPRGASRHLTRAVCFLWHFPWGRPRRRLSGTVFPWSPDFPLSLARQRPSGRLAWEDVSGWGIGVKRQGEAPTAPQAGSVPLCGPQSRLHIGEAACNRSTDLQLPGSRHSLFRYRPPGRLWHSAAEDLRFIRARRHKMAEGAGPASSGSKTPRPGRSIR